MKSLSQYINESLIITRLKKDWNDKLIPFDELVNLSKKALEASRTDPKAICSELSSYEDPDDLWDAFDRGDLSDANKWMYKFKNLLAYSDEWKNNEDEICDAVFDIMYDLMDNIYRKKL